MKVGSDGAIILRLEILKKIIMTIILAVTIPISVRAVAWGMALSSACDLAANALAARRYTSLTLLRLMRALLPAAALTAVMYGTVMLLGEWTEGWHVALRLTAKIVAGIAVYAAVAAATRMEAMREVMKIARDLLHRK